MTDYKKTKVVKLKAGEKYQRLFSKESGTFGIKSGHVILKPGENVGLHTTGEREEVIIILKGKGNLLAGKDTMLEIGRDECLYIPPQTEHDIKNTGDGVLEYTFITAVAQISGGN